MVIVVKVLVQGAGDIRLLKVVGELMKKDAAAEKLNRY